MSAQEYPSLLPCPFCGHDAPSYVWDVPDVCEVTCGKCQGYAWGESLEDAAKCWNNRNFSDLETRRRMAQIRRDRVRVWREGWEAGVADAKAGKPTARNPYMGSAIEATQQASRARAAKANKLSAQGTRTLPRLKDTLGQAAGSEGHPVEYAVFIPDEYADRIVSALRNALGNKLDKREARRLASEIQVILDDAPIVDWMGGTRPAKIYAGVQIDREPSHATIRFWTPERSVQIWRASERPPDLHTLPGTPLTSPPR